MHQIEREREKCKLLEIWYPFIRTFFDNTGFMQFYETGLPNLGNFVPPQEFSTTLLTKFVAIYVFFKEGVIT